MKLIEVWVLGATCGRVAHRVVFNKELFIVEVNDDRIATLLEDTRGVAHHGLRNHGGDFRAQIDTELDGVLSGVRIARNEKIAGHISQTSNAANRIVEPKDF